MFIVVHEDNDIYKESIINLDTVQYIRKNDDPECPNVKTLISVGNGLMAMGVIEDYEYIKKILGF